MSVPADDLLSAFHDGELNSAERAAVEQRLAGSAEARCELSEIHQVSSLLKSLPRECLPAEFPQQVLQAVEREMLIPSRSMAATVGESPAWSRRWVGAAAVLTSAAGLLLLVRAVDDRAGRATSESRQLAGSPNLRSAPAEVAMDSVSGDRRSGFGGGGAAPPPMIADAPASALGKNGMASPLARSNSVAASAPASPSSVVAGIPSRESNSLFFDQLALREAKIGDVVRAMQTEGDEVAVVWLTVMDRQEGLAGLQLLLGDHSESDKKSDKAEKPNAAANQMHAVFVESDAKQLATMLSQLRKESFLQSLEVDQPIELAQLDDVRGGRMQAAEKLKDSSSTTRRTQKDDAAKSPADATSAKRLAPAPSQPTEKKLAGATTAPKTDSVTGRVKGALDAKDKHAKQVTLELPLDALVQNQVNQQSRNRGAIRNQVRSQAVGEKTEDKVPADQRPMQVLFVVVDQSQAGKPPTTPSNSTKPASAPAKVRSEPAKPNGQDGAA